MSWKAIKAYLLRCKLYGWNPTDEGLLAFRGQIKKGLRNPETYNWEYKN